MSLLNPACLPAGGFNGSLKDCIDYALLCAGSSFTVGVVEEERDTASLTKMTDALKFCLLDI